MQTHENGWKPVALFGIGVFAGLLAAALLGML